MLLHIHNHFPKMFIMRTYLSQLILTLAFSSSSFNAQQPYLGKPKECNDRSNETGLVPSYLYTCNAEKPSCKAYLMFKTRPPYLSLSSISNLISADSAELARTNIISSSTLLPPDNDVIIPVTCSCEDGYYQANTTYVIRPIDTYFTIANEYQGLTTCDALIQRNTYDVSTLPVGLKLQVPLRCACPTQDQIANGTKFLLTYLIALGDTLPKISKKFNVSAQSVAVANGFSDENPLIYAFTTILIPLSTQPVRYKMRKKSSQHKQKKKKSYKGVYIGAGTGVALSFLCFFLVLCLLYYRRGRKMEGTWREKLPENFMDKVVGIGKTLKIYRYEELEAATNNFSPQKRLSNSFYKGNLRGKVLAIKKTSTDISKEIKILGNVNHFNLISLFGFCDHDGAFYLVYEYLEEGSLNKWLRTEDCAISLTWGHRVVIALDVANGLNYLHNFTAPAYVHKDINSCNILLNRDLRAKIANFSLARETGNSDTSCVQGVKGYVAPEYMQEGRFTPKVDVYAFGVVLLELITGREAVFVRDGEEVLLSETVISAFDGSGGEINELIDPRLQVKHPLGYVIDHTEFALRLLKLSVACLAREPARRLSMAEAVSALMKIQLDIYNPQSFSIE